jgi:hypothetical protein
MYQHFYKTKILAFHCSAMVQFRYFRKRNLQALDCNILDKCRVVKNRPHETCLIVILVVL